jgi:hypothetical protein
VFYGYSKLKSKNSKFKKGLRLARMLPDIGKSYLFADTNINQVSITCGGRERKLVGGVRQNSKVKSKNSKKEPLLPENFPILGSIVASRSPFLNFEF